MSTGEEGYCSDESAVPDRIEGKFKAAVICWFLGIGAALTWNSMLNISDYYYVMSPTLQHYPWRVLALVYQSVALGIMMLLAYYEAKLNTYYRVGFGYVLSFVCTIVLLMIDAVTEESSAGRNYRRFCILVGFLGVSNASLQEGLVGDLSLMDHTFLQSFLVGLAISGALTSVLKLFTKAVFGKTDGGLRVDIVLLFLFISVYQFVCVCLYEYVLAKIPIVKYYRKKAALEGSKTVLTELDVAGIPTTTDVHHQNVGDAQDPDRFSKKTLIYQNLDLVLDLWLIYGLTFSMFPGFLFKNIAHNQLGSWYGVVLVAIYNVFDVMGRCVTLVESMRLESRKGLMVACLSRLLLIPCFYYTATYGGRGWMSLPVLFLGLTNGYLTVCALVVAPRGYRAPEKNALGNLLFLFLLGGAFSSIVLNYL